MDSAVSIIGVVITALVVINTALTGFCYYRMVYRHRQSLKTVRSGTTVSGISF